MLGLGSSFFRRAFARLTIFWSRLEVSRVCIVELPRVISYRMRELIDIESPCWFDAYMERAAKTAVFFLFEAYDSCRLQALSSDIVEGIRRINLKIILGNDRNATECRRLLDALESSRFCDLQLGWSGRGMLPSLSPARMDSGYDYRFFNPFTVLLLDAAGAAAVISGMNRRM